MQRKREGSEMCTNHAGNDMILLRQKIGESEECDLQGDGMENTQKNMQKA